MEAGVLTQIVHSLTHLDHFGVKVSMKDKNGTELQPPVGKFRLVGVDTFDGESWIYGDFDTESEGRRQCAQKGGVMLKGYLYDDKGRCIEEAGSY